MSERSMLWPQLLGFQFAENIAMSENFILFNQLLKQLTFMNVVFTDEELLNIIIDALPPISQTFGLVIMGREIQPT